MTAPAAGSVERRAELIGIACVVAFSLMLSMKGIFAKYLFAEGIDVATVLAVRYSLGLPMMLIIVIALKGGWRHLRMSPRDLGLAAFGGFLGYYLAGLLDFTALTMIDVSVERVLLFSFPIFVLLLDSLRRQRLPPPRQIVALVGAEIGIVLVMGITDPGLFLANLEGGLWAIGSAFVFSFYFMLNQYLGPRLGSARMATGSIFGACICVDLHFLATTPIAHLAISWTALGWLAAMALFCSALPFLLVSEGIRRVGASRSALLSTLGPAATIGLAAALLGEVLTWGQLAGAALVVASILGLEGRLSRFTRRGPPSPAPESP